MKAFQKIIDQLGSNAIFKFMPLNHFTLESLINKRLFFSNPNFQNDPLENHYILDISKVKNAPFSNSEDEEKAEWGKTTWANISIESEIKDKIGICCFSKKFNEYLLWSHYANGAKGICLIFNRKRLFNDLKKENNTMIIKNVRYNGLSTITPEIDKDVIFNIEEIVFNKIKNWRYEKEVRIMCKIEIKDRIGITRKKRLYSFTEDSFKGIILSERFEINSVSTIKNIIKNCYQNKIPIIRAKRDEKNPEILRFTT